MAGRWPAEGAEAGRHVPTVERRDPGRFRASQGGRYGYRRITSALPNELQRQFTAGAANQKCVTDVTEFNVAGEKLYLSPVLDLDNGEIIVFETSKRPVFELVGSMLKKALSRLDPDDKPTLHSDQETAVWYPHVSV